MAILGVLSLIWLWACHSVVPFVVWWGTVCVYSLVYRGLYEYYLYTTVKSFNLLLYFLFLSPGKMYYWPDGDVNLPCIVCAAGFLVIGPILFLILGWLYLTKHIIPKQKRLCEDFLKIDKDKDKKLDLNITDVEFKSLKYDLKKKIEEYRPKPAIFLGIDDEGKDVFIPEDLWNHHIHCMGPTGAGKTATLMLPIAIQAIEKGMGACFIDLKGDYAFIKSIQQKCKEVGKKFYFFSIDPDERTESYNPLQSGGSLSKVDRIMSALKLNQEGAASYYTGQQKTAFYKVLKKLIEQNEHISLKSVLTFLNDSAFLSRLNIKEDDIRGLIASFSNIADYSMINEDGINLKKIMDDQDVVYFNLRSQINSDLAEALGRMIITDFKYWSAKRNLRNPKFFIFVDEFQDIASEYFIAIISKVRDANYCLVLANQSRGNLLNVSKAFHDAVMINSYTKVIFNQFEDAPFWSSVTGTIRVDEAIMRMVSGEMFTADKTVLDGKREREGVVSKVTKALFTANTFLMLPMNKSVTWVKGMISRLTNHGYYYSKEEYKALLEKPFVYEGGKLYEDPSEYQIKKESDEKAKLDQKQEEKGPVKEIKPEADGKNNNKKQNNKGGKNESSQSNFRFDGDDSGPGE
jgi:hypothetical protein